MSEGLRVRLTEKGDVVIAINDEFVTLSSEQLNSFMDVIKCAQNDAKQLLALTKQKEILLKNYNTLGRTINDKV